MQSLPLEDISAANSVGSLDYSLSDRRNTNVASAVAPHTGNAAEYRTFSSLAQDLTVAPNPSGMSLENPELRRTSYRDSRPCVGQNVSLRALWNRSSKVATAFSPNQVPNRSRLQDSAPARHGNRLTAR